MARKFTITTPSETVRDGPDGKGDMTFTVTNVSGLPTRGMGKVVPLGNTNAAWLTLANVEREFPVGGVHQFSVTATIPPGTPPGRYPWRFDVVSAMKSGEESDAGPAVAFEIGATEPPKKKIPWWVWLAIAIGVIVIAVVAAIFFRKPDPPPQPEPVPEVVKVVVPNVKGREFGNAILTLQNAGFVVNLEPRFVRRDPRILVRGINTVVDQQPQGGTPADQGSTVTIFVRRFEGDRFDLDLKGTTLQKRKVGLSP
jgi:hypothetical protein